MALQRIGVEGCHLFWDLAAAACSSLRIARSTGIFPGPHSIIDAVRGIVPLEWVVTLQASGIPLVKARSIASKVGVYFVTTAQRDIWQPRCGTQVAREHSLLITHPWQGACHPIFTPCKAQATLYTYISCLGRVLQNVPVVLCRSP